MRTRLQDAQTGATLGYLTGIPREGRAVIFGCCTWVILHVQQIEDLRIAVCAFEGAAI